MIKKIRRKRKNDMKKKIIISVLFSIAIGAFAFSLIPSNPKSKNELSGKTVDFKCPNDYMSESDWLDALANWISMEKKKNLGMSFDEMAKKRMEKLKEFHCEKSKFGYFGDENVSDFLHSPDQEQELNTMVFDTYSEMHISGLKAFNDSGLIVFYQNDLQKTCPFYKPNGVIYRNCVVTLEEKERTRLSRNPSTISTAEKYCGDGAAKTSDDTSLGYMDIYNTCMVYRLRQI